MGSHSTHHCLGTSARLALLIVATGDFMSRPALAQAKKDTGKAASVFDDEKKTRPRAKAATVSDRDTIGFSQENVAAQMNELEERMFRLSEALLGLEPENASRLRLALKFSREEQILEQMRETHKLLEGRAAQQGGDGGEGTPRQARAPPQPAAGRGPRLPAQAGTAAPDARDARPARTDRQGRAARVGLVALRHRATQTLWSGSPPAGPTWRRSSATSRP